MDFEPEYCEYCENELDNCHCETCEHCEYILEECICDFCEQCCENINAEECYCME